MLSRLGRRLRRSDDAGFSLVEVMVAIIMLGVSLSAFSLTFIGAVSVNYTSRAHGQAVQLANQTLEGLMAAPWSSVGLYSSDCGFPGVTSGSNYVDPAANNETVVVLGTSPHADPQAPYPLQGGSCQSSEPAVVRGGVSYTVATHVTEQTSDTSDYTYLKHITIVVSWTIHGTTHTYTVAGLRAPTATDVPNGSSGTSTFTVSATTSPSTEALTTTNTLTQAISLTATTNVAANTVTVSYQTANGPTQLSLSGSGTSWAGTIPADNTTYNSGSLVLTFLATQSGGADTSTTLTVTLTGGGTQGTCLTSVGASPSSVETNSSNDLTAAITLTATTTGSPTSVTVTYPGGAGSGTLTQSGNTWSLTVASGSGPFTDGTETFTFTATCGGGFTEQQTASVQLTAAPPPITVASMLPSSIALNCSGHGANEAFVTSAAVSWVADITGVSATNATVVFTLPGGNETAATPGTSDGSGGYDYTYTMASGTNVNSLFNISHQTSFPYSMPVTVKVTRSPDGGTATGSFTVKLTETGC